MATEQEELAAKKAAAAAAHAEYVVEAAERNLAAIQAKIDQASAVATDLADAVPLAQAALDDVVAERELAVAEAAALDTGTAVSAGLAEATGLEN
jgi:hypothetical protein